VANLAHHDTRRCVRICRRTACLPFAPDCGDVPRGERQRLPGRHRRARTLTGRPARRDAHACRERQRLPGRGTRLPGVREPRLPGDELRRERRHGSPRLSGPGELGGERRQLQRRRHAAAHAGPDPAVRVPPQREALHRLRRASRPGHAYGRIRPEAGREAHYQDA